MDHGADAVGRVLHYHNDRGRGDRDQWGRVYFYLKCVPPLRVRVHVFDTCPFIVHLALPH